LNLARLALRLMLGRRLPVTSGQITVPGLRGNVRIGRDKYGIPHVECDDPRDGAFAFGFCQGQDRSFQLELLLRVARGTVSEMAGPAAVPIDRLSRRIGFHHAAAKQLPALDADVREALQAYAEGVQAGRTVGSSGVAHEFSLLKISPTPWTPTDTMAITKVLSFTLASNWDAELVRLKVLASDGPEALRALDTAYPDWHPTVIPAGDKVGAAVDRLAEELHAFFEVAPPGGGSNNWVISGSKTATKRPIVACDPHLDASHPAHWYLISLRTPREQLCGASFVGGPVVLVGHNGRAAWGLTAGLVDNTDLFIEEIGPDGASVRQGDGFAACEVRDEVIAVKGAPAVTERVLVTPRGPVVSPALTETSEALSLRATWLDPLPARGFFCLSQVSNFAEFRAAFAQWPLSAQNLVYADDGGTIGWQLIGRAPVRKKGHGLVPLRGRDPGVGWHDEPVPYEDIPHLQNPSSGFIATANTQPQPEGQGPYLGSDFVDGYRLVAIARALKASDGWDVATVMRLQTDQHSPVWEEVREVVLSAPANANTLALLRDWDGDTSASSRPAALYELFVAEMIVRVAKAKAPKSWRWVVGGGLSPITPYNFGSFRRTGHLVRLLREKPDGWFARGWDAEVADALNVASFHVMSKAARSRHAGWGDLRPLVMRHPLSKAPGARGRAMGWIFNLGPVPCGGDTDVINQASVLPLEPLAPADNIPSLRAVIDVGAWHNSRFVLPGGQSGNPLSPHYDDLFELYQRGEGVPIAFTPQEMKAAAVTTLELRPAEQR
jgi:penicillin amidase